jgi:hypothetical protein
MLFATDYILACQNSIHIVKGNHYQLNLNLFVCLYVCMYVSMCVPSCFQSLQQVTTTTTVLQQQQLNTL